MANLKKKIVIWGVGGHALVVADAVRAGEQYEIAGFLVDPHHARGTRHAFPSQILGGREELPGVLAAGIDLAVVAIGHCRRRLEVASLLRRHAFSLATVIHPRAILASSIDIEAGTVVAAGAIVNPGVMIGENAIINTGAIVDHECRLEAGVHISPGARLAGNVRIGQATWIGIGATVIDGVSIGSNTIVGAGAVVLSDVPDGVMVYGVPARIIKSHQADTRYINEH
jgi:acetyltransferase EpsM